MRWPWQRRRREELQPVVVPEPAGAMLPRPLIIVVAIAATIGSLILLHEIASFVAPVFLGLNLVIAVMPLGALLRRAGAPKLVAALVSMLTVYGFLVVLLWSLYWSVQSLVAELPQYSAEFNLLYRQVLEWLEGFGISQDEAFEQVRAALSPSAITGALSSVASNAGSVLGFLATLFIVIFFLTWDSVHLPERMQRIAATHPGLVRGVDRFAQGVQRYWVVTTIFGLIVSALDLVALSILGVPLAFVWAVFAFVTNYIPNIGFVVGVIPPTLMALLANGPLNALLTAILFSVINFVMQSLIQPKVAGDAVGVTPATSFLSLLVWAFALGPVGALLALPATLAVKTLLIDPEPRLAWMNRLIAHRPDAQEHGRLGRAVAPGVAPRTRPQRTDAGRAGASGR